METEEIWKIFEEQKNTKQIDNLVGDSQNKSECCKSPQGISVENNIICENCGVILENFNLDMSQEWRTYATDSGFQSSNGGDRCGVPLDAMFPNSTLSTVISGNSYMSKINFWLQFSYDEKVIYELKKMISEIVATFNLPSGIIKTTLLLYKNIYDSKKYLEEE